MQQTDITFPEDLLRRAERKAEAEGVSLPQVLRRLLARWVGSGVGSRGQAKESEDTVERALSSYGMWSDRDPDEFLRQSRTGLTSRDQELGDARLDPR